MQKLLLIILLITNLLAINIKAKEVTLEEKITGLYIAFFNRAADEEGLTYWKNKGEEAKTNGEDVSDVLKLLAFQFAQHPSFDRAYGDMVNQTFVEAVYRNTLGREGDAQGVAYWTALLYNGLSRSDFVSIFVEAALTFDRNDPQYATLSEEELDAAQLRQNLLANKVEIALQFTYQLGESTNIPEDNNAKPEETPAYIASIKIISEVNEQPESVQIVKSFLDYIQTSTENQISFILNVTYISAPIARITTQTLVQENETITLNASESKDFDGTIVRYEWKEGDRLLGIGEVLSNVQLLLGQHTITLIVTDNDGKVTSTNVNIIVNHLPIQDVKIVGLNYKCSSGKEDVTNSNGEFICNVGDSVEFLLGDYVLGNTTASVGMVTVMILYPDNITALINVLQLLQTLDDWTDGTITIPDDFSDLDDVNVSPTDSSFDSIIEEELGQPLVPDEVAQEHMLNTLLAGKTLYTTIYDQMGTLESWSFNSDMTEVEWVEMVGGDANGRSSIDSINGMKMTLSCTYDSEIECEDEATVMDIKEISADYLVVEVSGGELGSEVETLRVYFDEEKAKEYAGITTTTSKTMTQLLAGKTLYHYDSGEDGDDGDGMIKTVISSDMTTWNEEVVIGEEDSWNTSIIEVKDNYIKTEGNDGVWTLTLLNEYKDYIFIEAKFTEEGVLKTHKIRFYYDLEKAKEYAGITNAPIAVIDAGTYRMIDGENFALLSLMGDGTFVYGENDLDVNSDTENGLEVGTYTFDSATQTLTFNATYDDNTAEGESGIATIGTTTSFKISLSGNDLTLVTDEGNLTMSKMDFSANDYLGTWRYEEDNGNFAYLILMDDGVVFYGEKDSIDENYPNNNGLEIGHYTFDSANNNITCNLFYDDNYDGTTTYNDYVSEFSGIGVLDTNTTLSASMSSNGNTLTVADSLVFTKE